MLAGKLEIVQDFQQHACRRETQRQATAELHTCMHILRLQNIASTKSLLSFGLLLVLHAVAYLCMHAGMS